MLEIMSILKIPSGMKINFRFFQIKYFVFYIYIGRKSYYVTSVPIHVELCVNHVEMVKITHIF